MTEDDDVTGNKIVRQMEDRIRELERHLGRKALEVEILREGLDKSRLKKRPCSRGRSFGPISEGRGGDALRRALQPDRPAGGGRAQDAVVVPLTTALVAARPTCGYRRITAILNRRLRSFGLVRVNRKRVCRIMKDHNLLLSGKYTERPAHVHDEGHRMRSNLRPLPAELRCTSPAGQRVLGRVQVHLLERRHRGAFIIDAHDREFIARRAVVTAGISGSVIRDIMPEAVERRFGTCRAPSVIEMLSVNGSPCIATETKVFARQLGLKPCFTPFHRPQSNGISDAFVKTPKRDYVQATPLPDAQTVPELIGAWIEDPNDNHPPSG